LIVSLPLKGSRNWRRGKGRERSMGEPGGRGRDI